MGILSNLELKGNRIGGDQQTPFVQDKTIVLSNENCLSFRGKREARGLSGLPVLKFPGLSLMSRAWIKTPDLCIGFSSF